MAAAADAELARRTVRNTRTRKRKLLENEFVPGDTVTVDAEEGELAFEKIGATEPAVT